MIQFLASILSMMIPGLFIGGLYSVCNPRSRERIFFSKKYLRENQEAWDEYCKDMTFRERQECFPDWIKQRKEETGHEYYWIPSQFHTEPIYQECTIDGVYYRGKIEEIAEQSKIHLNILKSLNDGVLPEYFNTK